MSPVSVSVAATGLPTFWPEAVFSATLRAPVSVAGNTGAALPAASLAGMVMVRLAGVPSVTCASRSLPRAIDTLKVSAPSSSGSSTMPTVAV